ncbi:hypothetical protein [Acuticoccus sediminis]|uniref:hypothetical protein n=1 Tax=Acuticoccus sediminis TaxID=2184697 RepID=UPI0011B93D10|nr:hypothetical protein [Acuticoccus sediminis]
MANQPPSVRHQTMMLRGRILQMFLALERVGATPIDTRTFHAFAFFSNVLSSIWGFEPLEGAVLKDEGSPIFYTLQEELDRLVGARFIEVTDLQMTQTNRLEATFALSLEQARPVLDVLAQLPDQAGVDQFLLEVADAFIEIETGYWDDAAQQDANYSDPGIAEGRVVDFGEWQSATEGNAAWVTTEALQQRMPEGTTLNRAEKINLYMQLMKKRAYA